MKILNLISIILIALHSCQDNDISDEKENIVEDKLEITILYTDTISNSVIPDVSASIYFYFDKYPFNYSYISSGVLYKGTDTIIPNLTLKPDSNGKIAYTPKDKTQELSFIIESSYYSGRISLSNLPYIDGVNKTTVQFQ